MLPALLYVAAMSYYDFEKEFFMLTPNKNTTTLITQHEMK